MVEAAEGVVGVRLGEVTREIGRGAEHEADGPVHAVVLLGEHPVAVETAQIHPIELQRLGGVIDEIARADEIVDNRSELSGTGVRIVNSGGGVVVSRGFEFAGAGKIVVGRGHPLGGAAGLEARPRALGGLTAGVVVVGDLLVGRIDFFPQQAGRFVVDPAGGARHRPARPGRCSPATLRLVRVHFDTLPVDGVVNVFDRIGGVAPLMDNLIEGHCTRFA